MLHCRCCLRACLTTRRAWTPRTCAPPTPQRCLVQSALVAFYTTCSFPGFEHLLYSWLSSAPGFSASRPTQAARVERYWGDQAGRSELPAQGGVQATRVSLPPGRICRRCGLWRGYQIRRGGYGHYGLSSPYPRRRHGFCRQVPDSVEAFHTIWTGEHDWKISDFDGGRVM